MQKLSETWQNSETRYFVDPSSWVQTRCSACPAPLLVVTCCSPVYHTISRLWHQFLMILQFISLIYKRISQFCKDCYCNTKTSNSRSTDGNSIEFNVLWYKRLELRWEHISLTEFQIWKIIWLIFYVEAIWCFYRVLRLRSHEVSLLSCTTLVCMKTKSASYSKLLRL